MDKLLHFFICLSIVLVCFALLPTGIWSVVLACFTALMVGIGKEVFDYTREGSLSAVDIKDIIADLGGILAGVLVIILNNIIY